MVLGELGTCLCSGVVIQTRELMGLPPKEEPLWLLSFAQAMRGRDNCKNEYDIVTIFTTLSLVFG